MRWFSIRSLLFAVAVVLAALPFSSEAQQPAPKGLSVDKGNKTITIDCQIAPRKIDDPGYKEIYPLEVVATWPWDKDPAKRAQKAHETVVVFDRDIKPSVVHKALEELGLKAGKPMMGGTRKDVPQGPDCDIFLEWAGPDGQPKKVPIERTMIDPKTKKPMPKLKWRFTGSVMVQPDPNKPDKVYGADLTGTLIAIFPVTNQTVFQTNLTFEDEKLIKLDTDKSLLPKEGTPAKLIIQPAGK
jgi:hypothetical protein